MSINARYERELEHLKFLHANLETDLTSAMKNRVVDPFEIQKLKKEKLLIKEAIEELKELFVDDDNAA
jgi:hypothetical protein